MKLGVIQILERVLGLKVYCVLVLLIDQTRFYRYYIMSKESRKYKSLLFPHHLPLFFKGVFTRVVLKFHCFYGLNAVIIFYTMLPANTRYYSKFEQN